MPLIEATPTIIDNSRVILYQPDPVTSFLTTYCNEIIFTISVFVIVYGIRWYYLTRYKK